jgi:hypothetical protein
MLELKPTAKQVANTWGVTIIQRNGVLFHRQLERSQNPSLDVIILRTNLRAGTLILVVRFFVEVIVFFCAKVCESTMGESYVLSEP